MPSARAAEGFPDDGTWSRRIFWVSTGNGGIGYGNLRQAQPAFRKAAWRREPTWACWPIGRSEKRVKIEPFADGQLPARRHLLRRHQLRLRRARRPASSRSSPTPTAPSSIRRTFDPKSFVDIEADYCLIPPNSFALAETVEYLEIPRDVIGVCVGKSTYARIGIIVNVTPLEPEWRGKVTIEISNTTPLPAKIYAGEGIAQVLFLRADATCKVSYADKKGKYQDQPGLTLPFVVQPP